MSEEGFKPSLEGSSQESLHSTKTEQAQQLDLAPIEGDNFVARFIDSFRLGAVLDNDKNLSRRERAIIATTQVPLKRALSNRHLQMIAIGGSIGAGLFISSGNSLKTGGPAGILIGYALVGVLMFCTMTALGELGVRYPVNGVFSAYTTRFMDSSWGFAVGWIYVLCWLVSLPTELVAASVTIGFWKEDDNGAVNVNRAAWVVLFYCLIFFINLFGVRGYGEAEVIFSSIKVVAVIGFIIVGIVITCGGGPTHEYLGGQYWHNPGAFAHGAKGVFTVFVSASYAFSGTEFAGLAAAETKSPHIAIPRATKQVFWRILLFYMVSIVVMGCLVPYDEPRLGTASDASASPFVIALNRAKIGGLPSVLNVVILLAVLSVGNSAIFGATRTVVSLAAQGHAPRFFLYIDKQGRPLCALALSFTFGLLGFISASDKYGTAFTWLSSIGGMASLFTWGSICVCHIRNRLAMKQQGVSMDELIYKSPLGIVGSIVGAVLTVVILALQFWVALFPVGVKHASAESFFQSYLSGAILVVLFVGHKLWYREMPVRQRDIDVHTGANLGNIEQLMQEKAAAKAARREMNVFKRAFTSIC